MAHTLYEIGISLYSDELYPDDYIDGQENIYQMNEEQYKKFNDIEFDINATLADGTETAIKEKYYC
jgi:hypothetical protein